MKDHIRTLLLNPSGVAGYRHVSDVPADTVLAMFGISGGPGDGLAVDTLLPLVYAPELSRFRDVFDRRITPSTKGSIYKTEYAEDGTDRRAFGLYAKILGREGIPAVMSLFSSDDQIAQERLFALRTSAFSGDSCYALGAVLVACAYRRLLLQGEDT